VPNLLRQGRGVIKLTLDVDGHPIDIIATHLEAMAMPEREAQAAHLLRRFVDPLHTTILLGDMNTVPTDMTRTRSFATTDRTHDVLTSGTLADARVLFDLRTGQTDFTRWATYPADAPVWPLDMALGSLDLVPEDVRVLEGDESDHRALYVAYRLTRDPGSITSQRNRHDAIRRRQLAQILQCDLTQTTRIAKLQWLREGTQFFTLFPDENQALASADIRL
jgi:endonuclease/exonuclease/phosphatase family metal-dependent hydrolase